MVVDYFVRNEEFSIGGISLSELLESHPTPLYVYSADVARRKYKILKERFPSFDLFYSLKANPNLSIARLLRTLGSCAEVSSLGELETAMRAGYDPEDIVFLGPAKTEEEIERAVQNDVYAIVAESPTDLQLIEQSAQKMGKNPRVLLRINTFENPEAVREVMVGGPSKFGFDQEKVTEQVRAVSLKRAKLSGVHVYSASQVLDAEFLCGHLGEVLELSVELSRDLDFELECIDFGGGFGVPYHEDEKELDLARVSEEAKRLLGKYRSELSGCRLVFESGRFLIAEAGVFVTRILRTKESRGRHFVVTDGGMNHFSRPAFMGINHPIRILNKLAQREARKSDVCGPCCTPLDVLGTAVPLPEAEVGDILAVFNAGAYGYSMSMTDFLSFGWPEEIMVDEGGIHLIRKGRGATDIFEEQMT